MALAALAVSADLRANPVADAVAESQVNPVSLNAADPACADCIPKLTPVELVIETELGSKLSTTGQTFPIRLATPIMVDGREVVAQGAEGQGEVVHAKKAGMAGSAGELVLAARFLNHAGQRIKLRSMRIASSGKDATGAVAGFNAAAAGAAVFVPAPVGLLGFMVTGRNIVIPKGTAAIAKTADDFAVSPPPSAAATTTPTNQPVPASSAQQ